MDKTNLKIPKELWIEIICLLQESIDHLDWDFDWEGSDDFEEKVLKLVKKLEKFPVAKEKT